MSKQSYSIVEYYAEQQRCKCGYCKSPNTNFNYGMWAHSMNVQDYQALLDRGWRRSGCYCYKPTMDQTCCPMYTIKCEALHFKVSKSQKKILKRMAKFLRNDLKKDDCMDANDDDRRDNLDINIEEIPNYNKHLQKAQQYASKMNVCSVDNELDGRLQFGASKEGENSCDLKNQSKNSQSVFPMQHDDNLQDTQPMQINPQKPCKKAKLLRRERKQNKLLGQGKSHKEIEEMFREKKQQNHVRTLEELFEEVCSGTNRLELRLVRTSPISPGYLKTSHKSYEVYKKYEMTVHGVPAEKVTETKYSRFLVKSPLQMKLVRVMSDEFLSSLDASANLYKKYQMAIHGDRSEECNKKSFFSFLVKSPLQAWTPDDGPPKGYGSFHEQYWLDGELIAIGVIDILPACISSVYFFYDPTYSHLSLGTFSSLREVYLTRQLNKVARDLKYYYMGFYIHTCPKMRYKAKVRPSKLLCPETYAWIDIEPCLAKLDKEKYSRLNDDVDSIDENGIVDIDKVLVLYQRVAMPYKIYRVQVKRNITQIEEDEVKDYVILVGMNCAQNMLLYRD